MEEITRGHDGTAAGKAGGTQGRLWSRKVPRAAFLFARIMREGGIALLRYKRGPITVPAKGLSERDTYLLELNYIEPCDYKSGVIHGIFSLSASAYKITPRGEDALADFEFAVYLHKHGRRHDYAVAIVGAVTGSLLTLLVEHYDLVFEVIRSLFL